MPLGVVVMVPACLMCASFLVLAFFDTFIALLLCTIVMALSYGGN